MPIAYSDSRESVINLHFCPLKNVDTDFVCVSTFDKNVDTFYVCVSTFEIFKNRHTDTISLYTFSKVDTKT